MKEVSICRKLFVLVANEYGYKGKEIARYLRRDPAVISQVLKDRADFENDMGMVIKSLRNLNI